MANLVYYSWKHVRLDELRGQMRFNEVTLFIVIKMPNKQLFTRQRTETMLFGQAGGE